MDQFPALVTPPEPAFPVPADTLARARAIVEDGTPETTRRAYRGDLVYFWAWAEVAHGLAPGYPVPVGAVVTFITDHLHGLAADAEAELVARRVKARPGPHRLSTIQRRVAALSVAHQVRKVENPCHSPEVKLLLSKARKAAAKNGDGPRKKRAATRDVLEALLASCDTSLLGVRDRALLLFAFASGGRRRSEVAAARVEDLTVVADGYVFHLGRSKTDQVGHGADYPVLGRAGMALGAWLAAAGHTEGPLFRGVDRHGRLLGGITPKLVGRVVKARAERAGMDPTAFGGHSLRSGFLTEGGRQGKGLGDLMALSGHRSTAVAMGYHQAGAVVHNPAARLVG